MRASRRAQRGVALLGLLAVAVMVFAYVLTSRLNAASQFVGLDRDHNAEVMARAKQALIGWMAVNAAGSDNNPGRLPCPQAWGDVGTVNEGRAAGSCSAPAVGWLPWRTLGMDRPLDASGNQIWYVISPGWHLPNVTATLTINSDTPGGQLSLDGAAVVALLIAPGPPLTIAPNADQVAAGCAARNQSQVLALPGTPPNPLDFLECQNGSTADNVFTASVVNNTVNPSSVMGTVGKQVFNDQVLAITAADVIPALEAAIADRMQREIAPALRAVYTSSGYSGIPSSSPLYPYPAPPSNPGTSSYQGQSGVYQGLLPVNFAASMVDYASTPANAIETLGYGYIMWQTCSWESAGVRLCEGRYHESDSEPWRPIRIEMTATFTNVAMGLRAIDTTRMRVEARDDGTGGAWLSLTPSHVATMNSNGSVTIRFWATLPNIDDMGWVTQADFRIRIERAVIGDHELLNTDNAATGWFMRNEWHRTLYYAVAQANTAANLASLGCTSSNCLYFNDNIAATRNIRALLVLAGSCLKTRCPPSTRPSGVALADYLEYKNADLDTEFEQRTVRASPVGLPTLNAPWNDRIVLVDWDASNPPVASPNGPQVVSLAPLRIYAKP